MPTKLPDGTLFNPFKLSESHLAAYEKRRQEEAAAEGLVYILDWSGAGRGTGGEYWVKAVPGRSPDDYTSDNLHRPGNRPASITYTDTGCIEFSYAVDGKAEGARTDGGPTSWAIDERGKVVSQEWEKGARTDGGPNKIWEAGGVQMAWQISLQKGSDIEIPKVSPALLSMPEAERKAYLKKQRGYLDEEDLSAHERMTWESVKQAHGGVWWQPQVRETETVGDDGSLVKRTHEARDYSRLAAHVAGRDLASFGWHPHRENGPAVETFHNGKPYERLWYVAGIANRKGGPAVERVYEDGRKREFFIRDGVQYNPDGAAYVEKDASGKVVAESAFDETGKRVKATGPLAEVKRALVEEVKADLAREKPTFATDAAVKTGARAAYEAAQAKPAPVKAGKKTKGDEAR
jgi:hypothetical protein